MRNPWLAIDVSTTPSIRARELRIARERFLEDAAALPGLRAPIVESWRRAAAAGIDPAQRRPPIVFPQDEARDRFLEHRLGRLLSMIEESLAGMSADAEHILAVTDADGVLLSVSGDARVRHAAAEELNMIPGARFSEAAAGTNAIGTALAAGHPLQVFAAEHFCAHSQWWTCVAAPIRDPATGGVLGTVNLTARMETVHPHSLALVMMASSALEAAGRTLSTERRPISAAPRGAGAVAPPGATVEFDVLGRDRAMLRLEGREVPLSQRHSEILVLLAAHPSGLTAEQLALQLYGDEGKPVSARAEFSRLRRVLGARLRTEPYRLEPPVQSDFRAVRQLLLEGNASGAAEVFRGSVLPRSEAPGVVELRDELDGWVRRAVMAAEDPDGLWSWLNTPPGEEDLYGWKRLLSNLPPHDGRRGLAAARVARLRALFGRSAAPTDRQAGSPTRSAIDSTTREALRSVSV